MFQKMTRTNEKGFTLIELMIVIAIIGILAAIAIPNFIAYRNKAYCATVESDANTIAAGIANYFSSPGNTSVKKSSLTSTVHPTLSNWDVVSTDPTVNITISVTDTTTKCPKDYRDAATSTVNPKGYWDGTTYIKLISNQ